MSITYTKELISFVKENDLSFLANKRILVTGSTGLIGSYFIDVLMKNNDIYESMIEIYALSRNKNRAERRFAEYINHNCFNIIVHDMNNHFESDIHIDYIIHAAGNSTPKTIKNDPVGTIKSNVFGTIDLLEYAKERNVEKFLFVSSSEIYGESISKIEAFSEDDMGVINPIETRASYSESKRLGENICANYSKLFGVKVNIARVSFAYGATYSELDDRVIPQFIDSSLNGDDIVLKSTGEMLRSYTYLYDVVSGLIHILRYGLSGNAYNISNGGSNVTIREIAEIISILTNTNLVFNVPEGTTTKGYSAFSKAVLNSKKLEKLGWKPKYNMQQGLSQVVGIQKENYSDKYNCTSLQC